MGAPLCRPLAVRKGGTVHPRLQGGPLGISSFFVFFFSFFRFFLKAIQILIFQEN
jgi:hypothetical protein